ncbi:AAA family ATPase [Escherichia coli]
MSRTITPVPTDTRVGLTSVSLGVIRSMEQKGVRLSVFKPIAQPRVKGAFRSNNGDNPSSLSLHYSILQNL